MVTQRIELKDPQRFSKPYEIKRSKLIAAAERACERLANMAKATTDFFLPPRPQLSSMSGAATTTGR